MLNCVCWNNSFEFVYCFVFVVVCDCFVLDYFVVSGFNSLCLLVVVSLCILWVIFVGCFDYLFLFVWLLKLLWVVCDACLFCSAVLVVCIVGCCLVAVLLFYVDCCFLFWVFAFECVPFTVVIVLIVLLGIRCLRFCC